MILSYSNDIIFLRTRKTGGTSTELVLSTWCSPPDVCSTLHEEDEPKRQDLGGLRPRRYYHGHRVFNHMGAGEISQMVPRLWRKAYRFAVERHPYEKVVSRAFWNIARRGGDADREFAKEVNYILRGESYLDRHVYHIDGQIAVNEVVRYDDLWDWMSDFSARRGWDLPTEIPRSKSGHRADRRLAAEILCPTQKRRIQEVADYEFSRFGFAR